MARQLDPKLQRIIEDAAGEVHPLDIDYSSAVMVDFAQTALSRHLKCQEHREQPSFLATGFQSAHSMLDDFDMRVLRPEHPPRYFEQISGQSRLSLPLSGSYQNAIPIKTAPQSIYSYQLTQQQPVDEDSYIRDSRAAVVGDRQQLHQASQVPLHDPVAIFHGIDKTSPKVSHLQEPKTPFNLSSYVYNPPATTPSIQDEDSSPSNRVSLRRLNNRPFPLEIPQKSQPDLDNELFQSTPPQRQAVGYKTRARVEPEIPNRPPTVQGIQLVSPHELPDRFRQVFPYELFNAVQSKCFEAIYKTKDNVVIAAPTGSGKTAILELAIIKLIQEYGSGQFKIVYQAPTKSLCSERVRDWDRKFSHLNLPCAELTGDTGASEMRKVGNAAIIVTTPEKWDSITRKWKDYIKLLQLVKLFLIDEVHILKDIRGATLEAVVSRMKSIGANVRFVALSATVPNSQDIATWLGKDHTNCHLPAHRETFGEEFRPVKLQKHVYGFNSSSNDFAFDSILDTKLPGLIAKHTVRKPMMVFCVTRKICESTARKLAEWWLGLRPTDRPWPIPTQKVNVGSPELRELVGCGVGFHHAGLDAGDRAAVETGFLKDGLSVICCTSTLAVGVNLPCHLVVIKNTVCYTDSGLSEYSDLEVMQMLGRAGRPQFDDSATAIIMTRSEKVDRYKKMISGQEILESTLHLNLIEHLNSEIGLGTVHDVYSAKHWLAGTFLSVRMRQNPTYYKFSCDTGSRDADERLEGVCERDIELLKMAKLITEDQRFTCTEYGQAMSKYMVQFETMKLLLSIPKHAKMTQILHTVSQAVEFKDLRLKPNERSCFRDFNKSPFIKAPIKENITTFAHKVSLIIQIHLGGVELPMEKEFNIIKRQFMSEKAIIFDRVLRLIRCVVECKAFESDATATCNALELLRSIAAGFWENSPLQLRQIPTLGPAAVKKLVQSNVRKVAQLASIDMATIERLMSRNPPFGRKILDLTSIFPRLILRADIMKRMVKLNEPVKVQVKAHLSYSNTKFPAWNGKFPTVTFTASVSNGYLAYLWRGPIKRLEKGFDLAFTCGLLRPSDIITCELACEEIVGTIQSVELKPEIPASAFLSPYPIIPTTEAIAPMGDQTKVILSKQEETEILAVLEQDSNDLNGDVGSDYEGESVFDGFLDIDDLENDAATQAEPEHSEPIQLENGKWKCNHKCKDLQGNYLTKNGVPCKHQCCHDGLEKPRKLQKKKPLDSEIVVPKAQKSKPSEEKPSKAPKKVSKEILKPKFRIAQYDTKHDNIEEIDLVDEPLSIMTPDSTHREYCRMQGILPIEGKPGSVRISKTVPKFSYASGSQPDLLFISKFKYEGDSDRSSPDFPSPTSLLATTEDYANLTSMEDPNPPSAFSDEERWFLPNTKEYLGPTSTSESSTFKFGAFENTFDIKPSSSLSGAEEGEKRPASLNLMGLEPAAKYRRMTTESEEAFPKTGAPPNTVLFSDMLKDGGVEAKEDSREEMKTKQILPAWTNDFDADFVAYFAEFAEFK